MKSGHEEPRKAVATRDRLVALGLATAWHLGMTGLLLALEAIRSQSRIWRTQPEDLAPVLVILAAYWFAAALVELRRWSNQTWLKTALLTRTLAIFAGAFLVLLLLPASYPPGALSAGLLIMAISLAIAFWFRRIHFVAIACIYLTGLALGVPRPPDVRIFFQGMETERTTTATTFYALKRTIYRDRIQRDRNGGGIDRFGDGYLLATGAGRLFQLRFQADGELEVEQLPLTVPLNADAFAEDAGPSADPWRFRVTDLLVREQSGTVRLFAAHHHWYRDQKCSVIRLSWLDVDRKQMFRVGNGAEWRTLFEAQPCLPVEYDLPKKPFAGHESGGHLALLDEDTLLATLGDHSFDGLNSDRSLAQDATGSYGKIIAVDLKSKQSEIFSMGHRNPQGLIVDRSGAVWSTEHGPEGGDELNRIRRGGNYGWPLVTLGTQYGWAFWPLSETQGEHDGYERPVFAWVPSPAISSLLRVQQDRFLNWRGDFLVGSLKGQTLFRVRIRDGRAIVVEPIEIGQRIRDLVEGADGRLVLWTDSAAIVTLEPASADMSTADGQLAFQMFCAGCHSVENGKNHGIGPDLHGMFGQDVASARGFQYSGALLNLNGEWTRERLDLFLSDPPGFTPGTTMAMDGITNADLRAALIDYLAESD